MRDFSIKNNCHEILLEFQEAAALEHVGQNVLLDVAAVVAKDYASAVWRMLPESLTVQAEAWEEFTKTHSWGTSRRKENRL